KSPKTFLAIAVFSVLGSAWGSDTPDVSRNPAVDVALLQAQLTDQQKQIDQLRAMLAAQEKVLDRLASAVPGEPPANRVATMGEVASLTPAIGSGPGGRSVAPPVA